MNTYLFFFIDKGLIILVLIYVNDMIVTYNNPQSLQSFVEKLNQLFALKDLGHLPMFLGIEVIRDETGMYLTQTIYIEELLKRTEMEKAQSCPTPAVLGKGLATVNGELMNNPIVYKSIMGALQ